MGLTQKKKQFLKNLLANFRLATVINLHDED